MSSIKFLFVLSALILFTDVSKVHADIISLKGADFLNIGERIEILEDKESSWNIGELAKKNSDNLFASSKSTHPSFGFTDSVYWVKFRLKDIPADRQFFIEISYPAIDNVTLYIVNKNSSVYHTRETGRIFPAAEREVFHRNLVFKIPAAAVADDTYFLKFKTTSSMNLFVSVWEADKFFYSNSGTYVVFGIYYGAVAIMIFFNLFIFISMRDKSYLFYSIYYSSFLMFQISLNGLGAQYLWPESPQFSSISIPFFILISIIFCAQFAKNFLNIKRFSIIPFRILSITQVSAALALPVSAVLPYQTAIFISIILTVITGLTLSASAIILVIRGYRPAYFYLIAWGTFWAGIFVYSLKVFSLVPNNPFTMWGMQAGSMIEVVLISLGLADRINVMKKEVESLNFNLEELVGERTNELNTALKEMEFKENEMQKEFNLAGDIQKGILPVTPFYLDGIRIESFYQSMFRVGGDFYDIFQMKGGYTGILMADASGHGMPAAFITALAKISFSEAIQNYLFPSDIFKNVNSELVETIKTDDFITAFLIVIGPSLEVFYGNASHQMAIVKRTGSTELETWDTNGLFLGALKEANEMYEEKRDILDYGDRILLYTDGLIDCVNDQENPYGEERLKSIFLETSTLPIEKSKSIIVDDWKNFVGTRKQIDDACLVMIEIDPAYKTLIEHRESGFRNLSSGKYDEALHDLKLALVINIKDEITHLYIGECYLKRKEYSEAAEHLQKFVEKNEYDANVWLHLAEALFNTEEYPRALHAAAKGYNLKKDFIEAIRIGARSLSFMGKESAAAELWLKITDIKPDDAEAAAALNQSTRK